MNDLHDLELLVQSQNPIIVIESSEELRALELICELGEARDIAAFKWTVTEGLLRLGTPYRPQRFNANPQDVLGHIRSSQSPGLYVLLDFHPFLEDPVNIRLLKDIALPHRATKQTVVLLSHRLELPPELEPFAAHFELRLPGQDRLKQIVRSQVEEWMGENSGREIKADETSVRSLIRNLTGLTADDARRVARAAIFDDGAITASDLPAVMKARYQLLERGGALTFEYETASFADVGGLRRLKDWLETRRGVFLSERPSHDRPKGILLLGVQGAGKSLAARSVAGVWRVPLLRLDFGTLYNKYHGETERNLRESLQSALVMAPCVLWIDEIEKGISHDAHDGGTSRRVLGTLLTWMAEKKAAVFIVATANDISTLPPELIRKGRLDEIFFVDLPDHATRMDIFAIHLRKRDQEAERFDLDHLALATKGFTGAEIEQVVVSALYRARDHRVEDADLRQETQATRPISVLMAEQIAALRSWAAERTVPAD